MLSEQHKNDSILYSFIVPIYNVKPDFLRHCIESILKNDTNGLEIILVDDCSTNECPALCDKYAKLDKRVKVFHGEKNLGVSAARNFGIAKSLGNWIIFVDADDWIDCNAYKMLSDNISDDEDIIIFSAYRESVNHTFPLGTSETKIVYRREIPKEARTIIYPAKELSDKILKQSLTTTHPMFDTLKYCWGKAFNRAFLISNKLYFADLSYCEDITFMVAAFQKARNIIQIPDRLYHYRISANSTVNSYRKNALYEQKKFLAVLNMLENNNENIYYAALLSMQICITRYFFHKERKVNFIKRHLEALRFFSKWPYSAVFKHVDIANMKKNEKLKAILIKTKLYYIYNLGTKISKIKSISYE